MENYTILSGKNGFQNGRCSGMLLVYLHSMSGQSVDLTTLFLGRLRPPKWLSSTLCTYFRQQLTKLSLLNRRKEKQKYVAGLGIEPGTPGSLSQMCY